MMATNKTTGSIDRNEDRYEILFENQVRSVALGDNGSDENPIDSQLLHNILKITPSLKKEQFDTPLRIKLAAKVPSTLDLTASQRVWLSTTIILPGSYLPL